MASIQFAKENDLLSIARCHKDVFPDALTSKMGIRYLSKIFSWYLSTDKAFLFFLSENNQVVGYAGGMINDGTLAHGSASSLTQHTFNDAIKALMIRPWLLLHRDFLSRYALFARNFSTRFRNKFRKEEVRSATPPSEPHAGLVVIGVNPVFQGKGFGSLLLQEFEKETVRRGLSKMSLSVKASNSNAIKAYERNGWTINNIIKNESAQMQKYIS